MQIQNRKPAIKGRTDLGVSRDETGAYATTDPASKQPRVVYRLRRITDGQVADFVDDGSSGGSPMSGRQALMNALKKRFTVYEGDEAIDLPVFFADKRLPREFASINGFPVIVADELTHKVMAENMKQRDIRRQRSATEWSAQREDLEVKKEAAKQATRKTVGK